MTGGEKRLGVALAFGVIVEAPPETKGTTMDLQGQHVVVLGGPSGIGLATAALAARRGATVTVVSRRRTSVDKALAVLPAGAAGRVVDLGRPEAVRTLFDDLGE